MSVHWTVSSNAMLSNSTDNSNMTRVGHNVKCMYTWLSDNGTFWKAPDVGGSP